jgi:hypothetical protein
MMMDYFLADRLVLVDWLVLVDQLVLVDWLVLVLLAVHFDLEAVEL